MSVIMDSLKKAKEKIPATGPEQVIKGEKKAVALPANIVIFAVVLVLAVVIMLVLFSRINANIKSVAQNSLSLEERIGSVENTLRSSSEELNVLSGQLKDVTSNMTSLEKKIVFSEESAKSFLSEIEDIKDTFRSLQQEYGPVSAQIQELQKNVGILAARTAEKK